MTHLAAAASCPFPHLSWWAQFLHPGQLRTPCGGYWSWSGVLSDLGEITLLAGLVALLRHANCHESGCPRLGRYGHQASGTKWCVRHLPQDLVDAHPKPHHLRRWHRSARGAP